MKSRVLTLTMAGLVTTQMAVLAQAPSELNDLEMAHAAVTASNVDIAYAHLALAFSTNPAIREFAETMIRDHSAVNDQVIALAHKLGVEARDNAFSRELVRQAEAKKTAMSGLRGAEFDRFYIENEAAYHELVNGVVADDFIPNIEIADVRNAFEAALRIFRTHEQHAVRLARGEGTER